ncbi:hypothetical protein ONS95_003609 [Cadophora gregata]|uniref:uncharacterized protein n=1 Tax=Cadophora gregata TaxID=51156 RepID=UPI0026DBD2AC|nr:uncharacterized protein ONS95_003609 [Cadophora gregata]KAK0106890.1 hypothetical protein ONS95_003609 [Cadophora gregata]KAK0116579.1 hypothetical protein ONS96_012436 [Cadophora gregata f. sp. sojae]
MQLHKILWLAVLPVLANAFPSNGGPGLSKRQTVTCTFSITASNGDTCSSIATAWGLTVADFTALNPGINCAKLVVNNQYCVLGEITATPTTTSSSKSTSESTSSTTRTTSSITTSQAPTPAPHMPTQDGISAQCNNWYLVKPGDTCAAVVSKYSITLSNFYFWNPAVGTPCQSLWVDYYVCVGIPGSTPIPGPQPQMPGISSKCNKWYLIKSGDTCVAVERATGLTLAQIRAWNPQLNSDCTNLWLDYYICTGVSS